MKHDKMMKVRMDIIGLYDIPKRFHFIKENHILETSCNLISLYKKCLRMGYDIREAKIEKKYFEYQIDSKTKRLKLVSIVEPSIKYRIDSYVHRKKLDKAFKKYEHNKRKEKENGTV